MGEGEMPPFAAVIGKAMSLHRGNKQRSVPSSFGAYSGRTGMRQRIEAIECRAHVEAVIGRPTAGSARRLGARSGCRDEGQIDRQPARMGRARGDIALSQQGAFREMRKEP